MTEQDLIARLQNDPILLDKARLAYFRLELDNGYDGDMVESWLWYGMAGLKDAEPVEVVDGLRLYADVDDDQGEEAIVAAILDLMQD